MITTDADRRRALNTYLTACLAQNILSPADLDNPLLLLGKLGRTLLDDVVSECKKIGRGVGAAASVKVAEGFFDLAQRLGKK